jgi:NADH-ubiquinone oxidoreductase chain 4
LVLGIPWFGWFFFVIRFIIKFPIYGLHDWLPKAHVEAPLAGSMILAGVILKLGGYGLMRVLWVFGTISRPLKEILMAEALVGGIIARMLCVVQSDVKVLVAYSSVAHIRLCFIAILRSTSSG